jgi:hypothetical protein
LVIFSNLHAGSWGDESSKKVDSGIIKLSVSSECYSDYSHLIKPPLKIVFEGTDEVQFLKMEDTLYISFHRSGDNYWTVVNMLHMPIGKAIPVGHFQLRDAKPGYKFPFGLVYADGKGISSRNSKVIHALQGQSDKPIILTETNTKGFPLGELSCELTKDNGADMLISCQCLSAK